MGRERSILRRKGMLCDTSAFTNSENATSSMKLEAS
jgi:hypothetical protein